MENESDNARPDRMTMQGMLWNGTNTSATYSILRTTFLSGLFMRQKILTFFTLSIDCCATASEPVAAKTW